MPLVLDNMQRLIKKKETYFLTDLFDPSDGTLTGTITPDLNGLKSYDNEGVF